MKEVAKCPKCSEHSRNSAALPDGFLYIRAACQSFSTVQSDGAIDTTALDEDLVSFLLEVEDNSALAAIRPEALSAFLLNHQVRSLAGFEQARAKHKMATDENFMTRLSKRQRQFHLSPVPEDGLGTFDSTLPKDVIAMKFLKAVDDKADLMGLGDKVQAGYDSFAHRAELLTAGGGDDDRPRWSC